MDTLSLTARDMAAQRQQVEHTCPVCGTAFVGLKVARYCAPACRARAAYCRDPEAHRARRLARYYRQRAATTSAVAP